MRHSYWRFIIIGEFRKYVDSRTYAISVWMTADDAVACEREIIKKKTEKLTLNHIVIDSVKGFHSGFEFYLCASLRAWGPQNRLAVAHNIFIMQVSSTGHSIALIMECHSVLLVNVDKFISKIWAH